MASRRANDGPVSRRQPRRSAASPGFLSGGGEAGAAIRSFDWARTPIGAPDTWPQSLRTVVRLLLTTNHPMFLFWGPDHHCFYNDAYSGSLGPEKHPAIIGMRGREAWEEIWDVIGPQIDQVMGGGPATWHVNQLVPIFRHGRREDVYWTYGYSPVDDEQGANGIGGVLVVCTETTAQVRAEERQAFLADLSDTLHQLNDPEAVMDCAAKALGSQLGAACCGYTQYSEDGEVAVVEHAWNPGGLPGVIGRHRTADYGAGMLEDMRAGRMNRINDVEQSAATAGGDIAGNYQRIATRALLQVPMLRDGELRGSFFALSDVPRNWTDEEAALLAEVGRRTLVAAERAAAQRSLRASEALLRAIGESSSELIYAKDREHRLLYANPATLKAIGRPAAEAIGQTDNEWHDDPAQAAAIMATDRGIMESGQGTAIEEHFTTPGEAERIFLSVKEPMLGPDGTVVGLVGISSDVTERTRDQQHLRLLVDELNHRVKNTLAIVQSLARQTFRRDGIERNARGAFEGRLEALATAHNLLTRERWEAAELGDLVRESCSAHEYGDAQIRIDGPVVRLDPKAAVTIAMALHELCTNASKYGALSGPRGQVTVSWTITDDDPARLHLEWRERGGPAVTEPTERGFGSRMIERALAAELRGTARLDFRPDGLRCIIDAPLPLASGLA